MRKSQSRPLFLGGSDEWRRLNRSRRTSITAKLHVWCTRGYITIFCAGWIAGAIFNQVLMELATYLAH